MKRIDFILNASNKRKLYLSEQQRIEDVSNWLKQDTQRLIPNYQMENVNEDASQKDLIDRM